MLDDADYTAPTRQNELDHTRPVTDDTDGELIRPMCDLFPYLIVSLHTINS